MFYNINDDTIEDLTGKGMYDLVNQHIDTPLPAYKTFMDDPLRILRAIRFCSYYHFNLSKSIVESATDPGIRVYFGSFTHSRMHWDIRLVERDLV